jgi:hypothetical protein
MSEDRSGKSMLTLKVSRVKTIFTQSTANNVYRVPIDV